MRIITLLLLMVVGAGQMWAQDEPEPEPVQFGTVMYNGTATNDGGTLKFYKSRKVELDGNLITVTDGESDPLTSADWGAIYDENDQIVAYQLFIMATPAVGHRLPNTEVGATVDFIQAEVVTSAQQAPSRRNAPDPTLEVGQTLPVKFYGYYSGWNPSDPATEYYGLYYVVMPADANLSVSITATFPEVETMTVDYIDPTKTGDAQNYSVTAYVLDGTEARLGYGSYNDRTQETWYVLPDDLTYTNGLELYGKVHLILADGKTMTYDGTETFINGYGTLDIYGQGGETEGAISATTTASVCMFFAGEFTINGGNVSVESTKEGSSDCVGIHVEGILTINNGTISGKSNYNGITGLQTQINGGIVSGIGTASAGINAGYTSTLTITGGHVSGEGGKFGLNCGGGIVITGGQIEATDGTGENHAGMYSEVGDIILGWTNPTDYIKASSYVCKNYQTSGKAVKTADGKALKFTDGNNIVKLIGDITDLDAIKNQKLTPYGIGGYCGTDDTETTDVDESKTLTWDIALKDEPTSATDLATTLTIEGCGTMASYTTAAPAPWSDKTINAANILASADVANVNAIAANIHVTLGYTGPVATTHTFNGYFVRKTADNTNISADVLSHNDQTKVWTLTMPDYAVNVSPKLTRNTTVSVEIVDPVTTIDGHPLIISGDDAHVKVTLNPVKAEGETTELPTINGIVTISVDNGTNNPKSYNVAIVDGEGHYYVTNLAQAAYDITAAFAGDDNYTASTTEAATTLEVCMILTETTCSLDNTEINVGEAVNVTVHVNEVGLLRPVTGKNKEYRYPEADVKPLSIDAIVTVKACTPFDNEHNTNINNYTTAIVNGSGTKTFGHLPAGPRTVNAVFAGDDRYCQSISTVENLQVNKTDTTVGVSVTSPVIAK